MAKMKTEMEENSVDFRCFEDLDNPSECRPTKRIKYSEPLDLDLEKRKILVDQQTQTELSFQKEVNVAPVHSFTLCNGRLQVPGLLPEQRLVQMPDGTLFKATEINEPKAKAQNKKIYCVLSSADRKTQRVNSGPQLLREVGEKPKVTSMTNLKPVSQYRGPKALFAPQVPTDVAKKENVTIKLLDEVHQALLDDQDRV